MAAAGSGVANPDNGIRSPNPGVDADLATYITSAKKYLRDKDMKRQVVIEPEAYAAQNSLAYYSVDDPKFVAFANDRYNKTSIADFKSLLSRPGVGTIRLKDKDSKFWQMLCSMVLTNKPKFTGILSILNGNPIELCIKRPESVFRLSLIEHVYSFDARGVETQWMELQSFNVSSNFGMSRNSSTGLNKSTGVSSNDRSTSENTGLWKATTLDFNMMEIKFPVLRSKRCLEVRPALPLNKRFFAEPSTTQTADLYICNTMNAQTHKGNEIYSHVFIQTGESTMVDPANPLSQIVNNYLQGDREISSFFYQVAGSLQVSQNLSVQPFKYLDDVTNYFVNSAPPIDGLVIYPLEYANQGVAPTFFNMFYLQYKEKFFEPRYGS